MDFFHPYFPGMALIKDLGKKSLFPFMLFACCTAYAQYGNVWPIGKMQGIDFNGTTTRLVRTGINNDSISRPVRPSETHTSAISDCDGKLLFYTNGMDIWNRLDTIMDNGRLQYFDRGNVGGQNRNCLIIPVPDKTLFYVFVMVSKGYNHPENGFYMSMVDMSKNSGLGKVIFKDSLVDSRINASMNLTYARHANDTDIWLLAAKDENSIFAFKITGNGLDKNPVISSASSQLVKFTPYIRRQGFMKMTNDYSKLIVTGLVPQYNPNGHVLSYDFDRKTGKLGNEFTIIAHKEYKFELVISMAFSPNDSLIYFSVEPDSGYSGKDFSRILQYNRFTKQKIIIKKFAPPAGYATGASPAGRLGMQTGPDGKTYLFILNKIYRINFPNKKGTACNLTYWDSLQFMNYDYNPANNDLAIFSLPNIYMPERKLYFNSSTEVNPCSDTTTFTYWGDTTYYKLVWHFGDGDSLVRTQPIKFGEKIKHPYKADGRYAVSLQSFHAICNRKKKYGDSIEVKLKPRLVKLQREVPLHGCYSDTLPISYHFRRASSIAIDWGNGNKTSQALTSDDSGLMKQVYVNEKTHSIIYTLTAANNCFIKGKDSFTSVFNPKPVLNLKVNGFASSANINGKPVYNSCDPMILNFRDSSKQFKAIKFQWHSGDSSISNSGILDKVLFKYTGNSGSSLEAHAYVTSNIFGCVASDSFYTRVFTNPEVNFSLDTEKLCLRNNVFSVTNMSVYKGSADSVLYILYWGDDTIPTIFTNNRYTYKDTGNFTIQMIAEAEYGCRDSFSRNVKVLSHPVAGINVLKPIQCLNDNKFEAVISGSDAYTIYWGDGNSGSMVPSSSGDTIDHQYAAAGKFNIMAIAGNTDQCKDTTYRPVAVKLNPKALFSLDDTSGCIDVNKFTVNTAISYPDLDSVSSVLHFGDGWSFSQPKGNFSKTYSYSIADTFSIRLVSTSSYGCKDSTERQVMIFPKPRLSLGWDNVCLGDSSKMTVHWQAYDKATKVSWLTPDGKLTEFIVDPKATGNRFAYLSSQTGTFNVKATVMNQDGCPSEISVNPVVFKPAVADFDYMKLDNDANGINYQFTDKTQGAQHWYWHFDQLVFSTQQNPQYSFKDTGFLKVILIISDNNNCVDSVVRILPVFPDFRFFFPNAVSINQDNLNETFGISSPQFVKELELEIYNRWGQLVYRSTDKTESWTPTMEGVYLYKVRLRDIFLMMHLYSGTVTILK
jgi:gliding motility-associated-like protein